MKKIDKNVAKIAITITVVAALFFALSLIPEDAFDGAMVLRGFAILLGSVFAIVSVVFWIKYGIALRKLHAEKVEKQRVLQEFDKWLENFDHLTKTAAELLRIDGDKKGFSKFGGLPVVPQNFKWPTHNGNAIPFLLQLDFSEINREGRLANFPVSGLLYLFVQEVFEPEFDYLPKILFYDKTNDLSRAEEPNNLQMKYAEFFVAPYLFKTYPDALDCDEAFEIYCARPYGGMDDGYDALTQENLESHLVGGWPSHLQGAGYIKDLKEGENDRWTLLLQIKSERAFTWGDNGLIYIYIREKDLANKNFDNIKLDMQCY